MPGKGHQERVPKIIRKKYLPFPLSRSVLIRGDKGRDSFLVELCDCAPRKEKEGPKNRRKMKREAKPTLEGEKPNAATVDAEKPLLSRTSESELGKDTTVSHLCNFKSN